MNGARRVDYQIGLTESHRLQHALNLETPQLLKSTKQCVLYITMISNIMYVCICMYVQYVYRNTRFRKNYSTHIIIGPPIQASVSHSYEKQSMMRPGSKTRDVYYLIQSRTDPAV